MINPNNTFGAIACHNIRLSSGIMNSISITCDLEGNEGFQSPYSALTNMGRQEEKEAIWEQIRESHFPDLPSRLKNIYLFDNLSLAKACNNKWYNNEAIILEANVINKVSIHKADMSWLDCNPENYESNALSYWSGKGTDSPQWEIILKGTIQLINWEQLPIVDLNNLP